MQVREGYPRENIDEGLERYVSRSVRVRAEETGDPHVHESRNYVRREVLSYTREAGAQIGEQQAMAFGPSPAWFCIYRVSPQNVYTHLE